MSPINADGGRHLAGFALGICRACAILADVKALIAIACCACLGVAIATAQDKAKVDPAPAGKPGRVQVRLLDRDGKPTELQTMDKVVKTDEEWRRPLRSAER